MLIWGAGWLQEHKDDLIEKCKCFLQVWVAHFRGSSAKFLVEFLLRWAPQGHFRVKSGAGPVRINEGMKKNKVTMSRRHFIKQVVDNVSIFHVHS